MTAKTPVSPVYQQVHNTAAGAPTSATAGAAATNGNPQLGSVEQFARFLAVFAEGGLHKAAAEGAGLALETIAAKLDDDDAFKDRYRLARRTRRMLIEDAVMQEALGEVRTDPINGVTRRVRNVDVLKRLAVREDVLDAEKPATAVQINNQQQLAADPRLVAAQDELRRRLDDLGNKPKRVIEAQVIDVPAPDPDQDLLE